MYQSVNLQKRFYFICSLLYRLSPLTAGAGFLALLGLSLMSCSKKKPVKDQVLPEITQEGKLTFGCYVDGTIWLPSDFLAFGDPNLFVGDAPPEITLVCTRFKNEETRERDYMMIRLKNVSGEGTYDLGDETVATCVISTSTDEVVSLQPIVTKGSITITKFDRAKNIFAGTFAFSVKYEGLNKTHVASQGRFDLGFDTTK